MRKSQHPANKILFFTITEYIDFAEISVTKNGSRRLLYNGYRFGLGNLAGIRIMQSNTEWRCNGNIKNEKLGRYQRCNVRVQTKLINGHEMIRKLDITHSHAPSTRANR